MNVISEKRIRILFWSLAVVFGFLQAWASRMSMVNDTISYLDMGDYIVHGHWAMAINGIWGPLYACLLGITLAIFKPSLYWEYPIVHLLLFVIFLFTLACFDFLLRQLIRLRKTRESDDEFSVPTWIWLTIGYVLFLWSSLALIGVSETNPDMIVAAIFYLACGFLVRIRMQECAWPIYAALGASLALGYLTKSIMFPIAAICFGTLWFLDHGRPNHTKYWLATVAIFFVISGPYMIALSRSEHLLTYTKTAAYNYAVHVNKIDPHYWLGGNIADGTPMHPPHELVQQPATFEFAEPVAGTYPMWYDPNFWYAGLKAPFHLQNEIAAIKVSFKAASFLPFALCGSVVFSLFVLFTASSRKQCTLQELGQYWFLFIPACIALGLYLIVWVEPRYIAPFITVILLCLFLSIHYSDSAKGRRIFSAVALLLFVMLLSPVGPGTVPKNLRAVTQILHPLRTRPDSYQEVAGGMLQMGVRPGDRISSLEFSNLGVAMCARLAKVKIVSEVYYWPGRAQTMSNDFWKADATTQQEIMQALTRTGSQAVLSHEAPSGPQAESWLPIGQTGYYLHWLNPPVLVGTTNANKN